MIFSSTDFLYGFLPLFLLAYYLTPRTARSFTIAFASYVFYGWWRPDFVLLMLFSTVVDFVCGGRIDAARREGRRGRRWVVVSCITNLGLLGYFKYANFGVETVNAILAELGSEPLEWVDVVLPVGISFYTFQTMSYTVDVYRGEAPPVVRFRDFMCYVALFPQLVAGPIVRYHSVAEQLGARTHTFAKFYQGVLFFQAGMVKKVLIADLLAPVADRAFAADQLPLADAWFGVLAYAFQIYFDFSGYSDMAIGLGLMIGFRFPINFDRPYRSESITDFWRRWHVSLSSWLRDYLYLPLGGNRRGALRTYVNLMAVMLLGGLWHGASWTFLAWGAYQGAWLAFERVTNKRALYAAAPRAIRVASTFVIVLGGWVLFRSETLGAAVDYFGDLAGASSLAGARDVLAFRPIHVAVAALAAALVWFAPTTQSLAARARPAWSLALQAAFVVALVHLFHQSDVPFLYYQF